MKKLFSLALAVAMLATATISASAATIVAKDGTDSHDVTATYELSRKAAYAIDVQWGAMKFNYKESAIEWDAEAGRWVETDPGSKGEWTSDSNKVVVTNRSSVAVSATPSYEADPDHEDITGTFTPGTAQNLTVSGSDRNAATFTLTLDGDIDDLETLLSDEVVTDLDVVGTATITIS